MVDTLEKRTGVSEADIDKLLAVFSELSLTDPWSRVKREDFTVRRFPMGFVNDIACCELTPDAQKRLCTSPRDPTGIVVKFVPKELLLKMPRHEFVACNTLLSHGGLTPRLTYIDERCMINEYLAGGRNYTQVDDTEPETVKELARVLAQVHSLRPPVSMQGYKIMNEMLAMWGDDSQEVSPIPGMEDLYAKKYLEYLEEEAPEIRDKYHSTFKEIQFKAEMDYMREIAKRVNSPLVFSHNDFNRGNRLVREERSEAGEKRKSIYLVDFDYSTFNHRGYDLGRYFSNYRHEDDMFGDEGFPEDEEMALFLEEYRQECGRHQGAHYLTAKANSLPQLIREAKAFTLQAYSDFLFCLMLYTANPKGPQKDYFLRSTFNRYNALKKQKARFTEDGTIPGILGTKAQNGTA